jgi:hypothetical protein
MALVFGYALLGAGWLILKTEGELQAWARRQGLRMFVVVESRVLVAILRSDVVTSGIMDSGQERGHGHIDANDPYSSLCYETSVQCSRCRV